MTSTPHRRIRVRPRTLAPLLATLALVAAAPTADAKTAPPTVPTCEGPAQQVFQAWGDDNYYALAPDGDFEGDLAGWRFSDDAFAVAGSEPFAATGTLGETALQLGKGAVATSPAVCIDATRETLRFFARGAKDVRVRVDAIFYKGGKKLATAKVGSASVSEDWQPTQVLKNPVVEILKSLLGDPEVAYRFTAKKGTVQIDNLFIDPRMNR